MGSKKAKSPKSSPASSTEKPEPEVIDNPLNSTTEMEPAPAYPTKTGEETLGKKGITLIDMALFGALVHYVAHVTAVTAKWHLSLIIGVEFVSTVLLVILVKGTFLYLTADEHRWFEWTRDLRHNFGVLLTLNFLLFWALPIFGQGQAWKKAIQYVGSPIYRFLDSFGPLRWFASTFIYTNPRHADFFVSACLVTCSTIGSLAVMFYVQLKYGELPWLLIFAYYFMWVGLGGRGMGAAYTFAHKEGHNRLMYKPWIRNTLGNFFENILGPFYGNMPWNFTTSHVYIHHRLDGGRGDTFYQWDLDRTSWNALMVFLHRIFTHMIGYASLAFFKERGQTRQYDLLMRGFITYTFIYPISIMLITHSWSFLLWVYIQPLLCMTYFLAFMNFGFHGWIEFDPKTGEHIWCVNSTTIIDGDDDSFGEDDHMAHHYAVAVYYKDLPNYQKKHQPEYEHYHGSVFKELSIVELSMFLLLKQWDILADHYVDYSGKLTRDEIKHMLKVRAVRLEIPHKTYVSYTPASWVNRKVPKQDGHDVSTGTIGPLTVAHDQSPVPSPTAAAVAANEANGLTKRK